MKVQVKRIVRNIASQDTAKISAFYQGLFDLDVVMDQGWIVTLAADQHSMPQLSIASHGGSGTEVPDLSIEVSDVDAVYKRARDAGHQITYELTDEPWGVRRFYVRDPLGQLVNILSHLK